MFKKNKKIKIAKEFNIQNVLELSTSKLEEQDTKRIEAIKLLTEKFKEYLIREIWKSADKGKFNVYITYVQFLKNFGKEYNHTYYHEVMDNIKTFLQEKGFVISEYENYSIKEYDISWKKEV